MTPSWWVKLYEHRSIPNHRQHYCSFNTHHIQLFRLTKHTHIKSLHNWHLPCETTALQWRHNGWDSVSNHQPHDCLPNRLFWRRSKKTSKLRVTGLCAGNSPGTGEFPSQVASNAENVSIWWRHHDKWLCTSTVASQITGSTTVRSTPSLFSYSGYRNTHIKSLHNRHLPCETTTALQWRHNECDSVSNHQPQDCLLNRLFWRRSKKTSKLRVTGLLWWEFTGDRWIPRTNGQ